MRCRVALERGARAQRGLTVNSRAGVRPGQGCPTSLDKDHRQDLWKGAPSSSCDDQGTPRTQGHGHPACSGTAAATPAGPDPLGARGNLAHPDPNPGQQRVSEPVPAQQQLPFLRSAARARFTHPAGPAGCPGPRASPPLGRSEFVQLPDWHALRGDKPAGLLPALWMWAWSPTGRCTAGIPRRPGGKGTPCRLRQGAWALGYSQVYLEEERRYFSLLLLIKSIKSRWYTGLSEQGARLGG